LKVSGVSELVESRTTITRPTRVAIEIGQPSRWVSSTMCGRAATTSRSWFWKPHDSVCTRAVGR